MSTDFGFQVWLVKKYFASDQHYQLENVKPNETNKQKSDRKLGMRDQNQRETATTNRLTDTLLTILPLCIV